MDIWVRHQEGAGCHCPTCTYVREKIVAPSGQALDPVFIPCLARDLLQVLHSVAPRQQMANVAQRGSRRK